MLSEVTCPKCNGKFKEFKHKNSGAIIDICQLCRSLWFDKGEFWTIFQNKDAKNHFNKTGLINKKSTDYKCPKCSSTQTLLGQGVLPMTTIKIEYCNRCQSFLLGAKEYKQFKIELTENLKKNESFTNQKNLEEVKENDFSIKLFRKRLKKLNNEVYKLTKSIKKPDKFKSAESFISRGCKAFQLIFKEPEIILFSLFQAIAIYIAYLLWVQMLDWIPEEVWRSTETSDEGSIADIVLLAWSFVCVGFAALPIGFFTACMGVSHILTNQGKESTFLRCFKFTFPKTWPIWIFSWIDAWITVIQILKRLPKEDDNTTATQRAISEAMYYA